MNAESFEKYKETTSRFIRKHERRLNNQEKIGAAHAEAITHQSETLDSYAKSLKTLLVSQCVLCVCVIAISVPNIIQALS